MTIDSSTEKLISDLVDAELGIIHRIDRYFPKNDIYSQLFHYYSYASNTKTFCQQSNIRYGKGVAITKERAVLKSIGEAVERYCSAIYCKSSFPLTSFNEAKFNALNPKKIELYEKSFYQDISKVKCFDENTTLRWSKTIHLQTGDNVFLPASMIYLPYIPDSDEDKILQNISTGLACHTSYFAAASNAINEIIERDAFMIHWRNSISPPQIELDSLPSHIQNLIGGFLLQGFDFFLFNITTDLKVPTVLCALKGKKDISPKLALSGACKPSFEEAILSAIEELELSREYSSYILNKIKVPSIFKKIEVKFQDDHVLFWNCAKNLKYMEYFFNSNIKQDYSTLVNLEATSIKEVYYKLINRLSTANMDVYLSDLTSNDIKSKGLTVVRAIIPKAHPLSFGYGYERFSCKRLKSVPEKLGYNNTIIQDTPHPFP